MSHRIVYANTATFSPTATHVSYAATSSFIGVLTVEELEFIGGGVTGSIITNLVDNISSSTVVDTIPVNKGNSVRWLVFISDGINSKTSKIVANWHNTLVNYYSTETRQIGSVPVQFSVTNSGVDVGLLATPTTGTWKVKLIRTTI